MILFGWIERALRIYRTLLPNLTDFLSFRFTYNYTYVCMNTACVCTHVNKDSIHVHCTYMYIHTYSIRAIYSYLWQYFGHTRYRF